MARRKFSDRQLLDAIQDYAWQIELMFGVPPPLEFRVLTKHGLPLGHSGTVRQALEDALAVWPDIPCYREWDGTGKRPDEEPPKCRK